MVEFLVGEQQRIAAGEKHVAHLRVRLDVAESLLVFRVEVVVLRVADEPAARAIAAIGGAAVGDEEQHAVGITVDEAGHGGVFVLAERVEHLARGNHHLVTARDELLAQRAIGVPAVDEVEKIRRDRERKLLVGEEATGFLGRRECHMPLELLHRRDAVLQLPSPVAPIGFRHVLPKALALEPGGAVFRVGHVAEGEVVGSFRVSNGARREGNTAP